MRFLRWTIPGLMLAVLLVPQGAFAQTFSPRIIAGNDVEITDHPWQIALTFDGGFICGGSILDQTTVITAAHCVTSASTPHTQYPASRFRVRYGTKTRASTPSVGVASVAVPRGYTGAGTPDESYDLALLTLSSAIDLSTANAKAIPLASGQAKSTGNAFVTGWGRTTNSSNASSTTLKGVEVPLRADSICDTFWNDPSDAYPTYEASRSVCAGGGSAPSNNPDTCDGDSGGPLAIDTDPGSNSVSDWRLLGLTSFGVMECGAQNAPAVYTYVEGTNVRDFITSRGATDYSEVRALPVTSPGGGEGSGSGTVPGTPATVFPPATTAARDTTRPTARVAKISCTKKRKCGFRVSATDTGGAVTKLSATVSRKVRICKKRGAYTYCRVTSRTKTLKPKRVAGGFTFSASLVKATYKLTAVATDAAGNRSTKLSKTFRVR